MALKNSLSKSCNRTKKRKIKNNRYQPTELVSGDEMLFDAIADTAPVMIWISGTDGCYYFNKVWLEFTGKTLEQEQGNGWTEGVHPEDFQSCVDTYIAAFDRGEKFQIEYRLKRFDGEYRWILATGKPWFLDDGSFAGYIGSGVDIQERKLAELAKRENCDLLRSLIEKNTDPMFIKNIQGQYLIVNQAATAIFGKPVEEIIGKDDAVLFPEEIALYLSEIDRQIVTTGETKTFEENISTDEGVWRFLTTKTVYRDAQGKISGLIGIARDITERRQAEIALTEANEQLEIKVEARTAQLNNVIKRLKDEIAERKQAEIAQRESEKYNRTLFEKSPIGLFLCEMHGKLVDVNPAFAAIIGRTVEETLNLTFWEITPEKYLIQELERLESLEKSGRYGPYEKEYYHKDGHLVSVRLSGLIIEKNSKRLILSSVEDITARKMAEDALQKSEMQLRLALNAGGMGVWDWDIETGRIAWSDTMEALYGIPTGTFSGSYKAFTRSIYPEDRKAAIKAIDSAIVGKSNYEIEYRIILPDGTVRWLASKGDVLRDQTGKAVRTIGTGRDITARKIAELKLQQQAQIIAGVHDSVISTDLDGYITSWNQSSKELFGYTAVEAIGKHISLIYPPSQHEFLAQQVIQPLLEKGTHEVEIKVLRKSGEEFYAHLGLSLLRDSQGAVIGMVGSTMDISDRKSTEEALRESQRFIEKIADATPNILYVYDMLEQRNIWTNRELTTTLGYTIDQIQAMGSAILPNLMHPDDFAKLPEYLKQFDTAKDGDIKEFEYRMRHKDGSWRWLVSRESVFSRTADGLPKQRIGAAADISDRKIAEVALRQSEERYRSLIAATSEIVWVVDPQGQTVDIPAWRAYTGQTVEEVRGLRWLSALHPDDRSRTAKVWADAVANKTLFDTEYRIRSKDGIYRYFSVRAVPVLAEDGSVREWVGICTDIHDRKLAENALQQKEEFLRSIYEGVEQTVFVLDVQEDGDLHYVGINPVGERISGLSNGEWYGKTPEQIFGLVLGASVRQRYTKCLQAGEVISYEELVTFGGVDTYALTTLTPVRNVEGRIYRIIGTVNDITERKLAEEALRQSEAQLRQKAQREQLLNQIASQIRESLDIDTILATTVQTIRNLLQVDRCIFIWYFPSPEPVWHIVHEAKNPDLFSLLGYYPADVTGTLAQRLFNLEIYRVDDVAALSEQIEREYFLSCNCKSVLDLLVNTRSGAMGVVSCIQHSSVRSWSDEEVELLRAVCDQLAIAISQAQLYAQSQDSARLAKEQTQQLEQALQELQQTQTQLIQTEKMSSLGQMVAGIAHELNNPTSFIHGNITHAQEYIQNLMDLVQLYQQEYPNPTPQIQDFLEQMDFDFITVDLPKLLKSMKMGTERISQMVVSLRNFSRLDEAEVKDVDLHEGIDNTLLILSNRLKQGITVIKQYGILPLIECYPAQLNQVFMNIIGNAIDALIERNEILNKQITITTKVVDNGKIKVQIGDNGFGIPPKIKAKIFDPFFTTKKVGQGTGLGLSICYKIVQKHQGNIEVNSQMGSGCEFVITLPVKQGCAGEHRGQVRMPNSR